MQENSFFLDHHLAQTTLFPFGLEISYARGIYLYDTKGNRYMDMISGVGVSGSGHANQFIHDAIKKQLDQHAHIMVYGEYVQSAQLLAAKELTELLPKELDCCYFVNSGTEANEAALKLAKRITGRTKIISFQGAYHGSTHGSLSISGNETKKSAFRPLLPDVHFIRFNEPEDLHLIDETTACVIIETIQGDAGIRIPDISFMKALRAKCSEHKTILIFDEIQCGLGRAGSMFAFEQFGIVPDILTLGKALGGGMPVGCMVSSTAYMKLFTHHPMLGHISTFAGHPVICAAVAANLQWMKQTKIVEEVTSKGQHIAAAIGQHPLVKEIRYRGMFFAIDLDTPARVQRVVETCLQHGLIGFWFLSCPASFRIAPPLTITYEEIDAACLIIRNALDASL